MAVAEGGVAGSPSPRLHFIDGLRGLAMLLVLLYHCWLFGGKWRVSLPLGGQATNLAAVLGYGHVGVNLFLVLSGFCLYWPFARGAGREPTLLGFARKRCRRILPPYYVTLVVSAGLLWVQAHHHHTAADVGFALAWLGTHALMVHNLRPEYVLSVNGSLWSLALEFQLYVLFPVLVEAFRRFPVRGVLLTVFVVSALYRWSVAALGETDAAYTYVLAYSVFGRCFEFALGMSAAAAVARWHATGRSPLRGWDSLLFLLVPACLLGWGGRWEDSPLADAAWGVLFAGLLLAASRPGSLAHRLLSARPIVALGIFSYSVYLIHLPLVMALGAASERRHFSNAAQAAFELLGVAPLMLLLGYVFHRLFERPFMNVSRTGKPKVSGAAI